MDVTKIVFFVLPLVFLSAIAVAQEEDEEQSRIGSSILDDTTQLIYGPTTSLYTYQSLIKDDTWRFSPIDTGINNLHRFNYVNANENRYQNLGNIATAAKPIFYQVPDVIGVSSGFTVYDIYFQGPDDIKYYDTKSPFTEFAIIWGGQGRSLTKVDFSRNIDERSNVGFEYRGLFIDHQIDRQRRGDRNVLSNYYNLHFNYNTRDRKYTLLSSFSRNRHKANETGGATLPEEEDEETEGQPFVPPTLEALFDEDRPRRIGDDIRTAELRTNFRVYQQYIFSDLVQIYHQLDIDRQMSDYIDETSGSDTIQVDNFYGFQEIDTVPPLERSVFFTTTNQFGVKGKADSLYYELYYRARNFRFDYQFLSTDTLDLDPKSVEHYGGVNVEYRLNNGKRIFGFAESLQARNFKIGFGLNAGWFDVMVKRVNYQPSFLQLAYRGSRSFWNNDDFSSVTVDHLDGGVNITTRSFYFRPRVKYSIVNDYIYFRESFPQAEGQQWVEPVQNTEEAIIFSPELDFGLRFLKNFHLKGLVKYTNVSGGGADAFQVPEWFANLQVYYGRTSFGGNLQWQLGIDTHWKSSYLADGYNPAIQQFFVQERPYTIPSYAQVDLFINAKIKTGRFFIKYSNLLEIFTGTGYLTAPYYPGQSNILDAGIHWALYD